MVYILQMEDTEYFKIGYTDNPIELRVSGLQTGNPEPLIVRALFENMNTTDEKLIHSQLLEYKTRGGEEWFKLHLRESCIPVVDCKYKTRGGEEWFKLPAEVVTDLIRTGENYNGNESYSVPTFRTSAFDVRQIRGGQYNNTTERREDVPDGGSQFDNARDQPVFPVDKREREISLQTVFWEGGKDNRIGDC